MKIFLLTHEQELKKTTNTGSIAIKHCGSMVERIVWQRTNPDEKLLRLIDNNKILLLYPSETTPIVNIEDFDNIVLIDSTWQESRKIINKSPYLQKAPRASLKTTATSRYKLRRNQVQGGLCTIECVIEWLRIKNKNELAATLESEFSVFNQSL